MEVHGLICLCMCIFSLPDISAMDEAEEPCPVDEDTKCINPSVTCEPIQDIKNKQSFVCTDNWNANSVCTLTCQEGNEVDGQKTITCRDDGTWDGGPPTCKVVTCDHIEGIKNNQSLECTDGWNAKSICTLTCKEGFQNKMDGQKNITCRDNGTWDGGPLTCNEVQTPNTAWIIVPCIVFGILFSILVVKVIYWQYRKRIGNEEQRGDPESHSSGDRSATGSVTDTDAAEMTRLLSIQEKNYNVVEQLKDVESHTEMDATAEAVPNGGAAAPAAVLNGEAAAPAAVPYGGAAAPTAVPNRGAAAPAAVPNGGAPAPAAVPNGGAAAPAAVPNGCRAAAGSVVNTGEAGPSHEGGA